MRRRRFGEGDPAGARPIEARLAQPEPDDGRVETVDRLDRALAQAAGRFAGNIVSMPVDRHSAGSGGAVWATPPNQWRYNFVVDATHGAARRRTMLRR